MLQEQHPRLSSTSWEGIGLARAMRSVPWLACNFSTTAAKSSRGRSEGTCMSLIHAKTLATGAGEIRYHSAG